MEIGERIKTVQKYGEEYWIPEETCCYSDSSGRPLANAGVKNSQWSKIIMQDDIATTGKEAQLFGSKIWERKEHNRKAERINNMEKSITSSRR